MNYILSIFCGKCGAEIDVDATMEYGLVSDIEILEDYCSCSKYFEDMLGQVSELLEGVDHE